MPDILSMTIGQVVDFCKSYNDRQKTAQEASDSPKSEERRKSVKHYRLANQDEINAYFSR